MRALKAERFENQILRRDILETLAALIVVAVFTPVLFQVKEWTACLGVLVIILGVLEIVIVLNWVRWKGASTPLDIPLADYCRAERVRVERQIVLLRNVAWWYIIPCLSGVCLFVIGAFHSVLLASPICLVVVYFGFRLYAYNQHAVTTQLIPLRDSLQRTEQDLLSDAPADIPETDSN